MESVNPRARGRFDVGLEGDWLAWVNDAAHREAPRPDLLPVRVDHDESHAYLTTCRAPVVRDLARGPDIRDRVGRPPIEYRRDQVRMQRRLFGRDSRGGDSAKSRRRGRLWRTSPMHVPVSVD